MSTPLAVLVGGGHARYLLTAADHAQGYLRDPRTIQRNRLRSVLGFTPAQLMSLSVLEATEIRTAEEIDEVVRILDERGVVP